MHIGDRVIRFLMALLVGGWAGSPLYAQGASIFGGVVGQTAGTAQSNNFGWRPVVGVMSNYIVGLDELETENGERLPPYNSLGVVIHGGVSGARALNDRSSLALTYRGMARYNTRREDIRQSHVLSMGTSHRFSPRWNVSTTLLGGVTNGGLGYGAIFGSVGGIGGMGGFRPYPGGGNPVSDAIGDPEQNDLVDDEIFDQPAYFASGGMSTSYSLTNRWSLSAGSMGFITRRASGQFGMNGYTVRGGAGYALTQRSSINVNYGVSLFDYHHAYGGNFMQTLTLGYNTRLTRRLSLNAFGGGFRWRSNFTGTVPLDPLLAELLGKPTGIEIRKLDRLATVYGANLSYTVSENGSIHGFFRRQAFPGNGLYLGTVRNVAGTGYSYAGVERWVFSIFARYSDNAGIQQPDLRIRSVGVRASAGYQLWKEMHLQLGAGYRARIQSDIVRGRQAVFYAGLTWSPGTYPLPLF